MILCVLLVLALSDDTELPFADDETQENENLVENEKISKPFKVESYITKESLQNMWKSFGLLELIVAIIFSIYLLIYFWSSMFSRRMFKRIHDSFQMTLGNYFSYVPSKFRAHSRHNHEIYVTGRTSYQGGQIKLSFTKRSDIIGILYDWITKSKNRLSTEFSFRTTLDHSGLIYIAKEEPSFAAILELKQIPFDHPTLKCYTDLGESGEVVSKIVEKYLSQCSADFSVIEIGSTDRFGIKKSSLMVSRFEIELPFNPSNVIDSNLADLFVQASDAFISLEISKETRKKISKIRESLKTQIPN